MHQKGVLYLEFKRGQFSINGHHSSEFNVYMRDRPVRVSAGRVIELRERPGNDSIVIDYKHYRNAEWSISCYAKVKYLDDVSNQEDLIKSWLDTSNYSDFSYFFDDEYIYQAVVVPGTLVFTGSRRTGNLIPFEFVISLQPMKETYVGRYPIEIKNKDTLVNIRKYHSKPRIHILGRGDISFYINEIKYELKNVPEDIIIDSQIEESFQYQDGNILFLDDRTLFKDFPLLPPGTINLKYEGNVDKFEIIPRWVTKV